MNTIASTDLLATAQAAASAAADVLCFARENGTYALDVQMKESIFDPISEADRQAQEQMIAIITKNFPEHRILAEEEGADSIGNKECPYRWIIDPLDGTRNFIHGKKNFGSIVAVEKNGELLAGCILLPLLGYTFTATKGGGARVNGVPVALRKTLDMQNAVLCSNVTRRAIPGVDGVLRTTIPNCASIENYGCTAQAIGDILLGWNDGMLVKGLRIWDIAAGCLMLQEAGGKYRFEWLEEGKERGGLTCVASTAPIFDELCSFAFDKNLV